MSHSLARHTSFTCLYPPQPDTTARALAAVDENGVVNSDLHARLSARPEFLGVVLYLTFLQYYIQLFTAALTIEDIHHKSGFILCFLAVVRRQIRLTGHSLDDNFLTEQTYKDVVISVCGLLLFIKVVPN